MTPKIEKPLVSATRENHKKPQGFGEKFRVLVVVASVSFWIYWKIDGYMAQRHREESSAVAAAITTGIEPHWYRDDLWLRNESNVTMTNIVVHVLLVQKGQTVDDRTLKCSDLPGQQKHVWSGGLAVPGGEIGPGTAVIVSCDQLLISKSFTY